jgi:hypothetical protein
LSSAYVTVNVWLAAPPIVTLSAAAEAVGAATSIPPAGVPGPDPVVGRVARVRVRQNCRPCRIAWATNASVEFVPPIDALYPPAVRPGSGNRPVARAAVGSTWVPHCSYVRAADPSRNHLFVDVSARTPSYRLFAHRSWAALYGAWWSTIAPVPLTRWKSLPRTARFVSARVALLYDGWTYTPRVQA